MSITIEQVQEIKTKAEQRRRSVERARGSMEQLMRTLKNSFSCDTVEEAEEKLAEFQEKGERLSARIEKLKTRVAEMWEQIQNSDNTEDSE